MKNKNNIILAILLAIVISLGVGYAAFSSTLNISATGAASKNWNVTWGATGAYTQNSVTQAAGTCGASATSGTTTNLTLTPSLVAPGDYCTYTVTVTNAAGSANAKVGTVLSLIGATTTTAASTNVVSTGNTNIIGQIISTQPVNTSLAAGATHVYKIKVSYNPSATTATSATGTFKLSANYIQA